MTTIAQRLDAVRSEMKKRGVQAFIVYSSDPHNSEYLPSFWKERVWISGFTGSAGFVVITLHKAGLWTDGRYFVQAAEELQDSGFTLFKEGVEGTPNYVDWLLGELQQGDKIALNTLCTSHSNWQELEIKFQSKGISVIHLPILKTLWIDRPESLQNPIFIQSLNNAGQSVGDKIQAIRQSMQNQQVTTHIITTLDDIAWITNLRGSDVNYNPVFLSYLIITQKEVKLFVDLQKCDSQVKNHLNENEISLYSYDDFFLHLQEMKSECIWISSQANQAVFQSILADNKLFISDSPSQMMKAQKNKTELKGFGQAMLKDAIALVNFLYWFESNIGKTPINEYTLGRTLEDFRKQQPNFIGNSFNEIIGYQENGAIIHYSAKEKTAKQIKAKGTILIDSGGQYLEGTTDITRVIVLGDITDEFKKDYTLVLKGMIALSQVHFIKGTRGVQLDAFARMPLWMQGRDYPHGTGHGVGCFLNVHEGPQNIRKDMRDIPLLPGMVCSNEPGLYRENQYGIRIENLIAVKEMSKTSFGEFYGFETLTLCPIDTKAIAVELLNTQEKQWLNTYHKRVEDIVSPFLESEQKLWLHKACKAI